MANAAPWKMEKTETIAVENWTVASRYEGQPPECCCEAQRDNSDRGNNKFQDPKET